jgi:protein-S-isoprenylcysteine O-methyltransferase Ste14
MWMAELALERPSAERPASRLVAVMLDIAERVVLALLFVHLVAVNFDAVFHQGHWYNATVLLSEGLVVALLMIRRKSDAMSARPAEWLFAFFATAAPLLVRPGGGHPLVPLLVGFILMFGGMLIQLSAKMILWRSFGIIPANRGVKIEGPYRFVRHPMYFGYLCVHVGFLLMSPNPWNFGLYCLSYVGQVLRLLAEERLLLQDPAYAAYAARVRWHLIPGVF